MTPFCLPPKETSPPPPSGKASRNCNPPVGAVPSCPECGDPTDTDCENIFIWDWGGAGAREGLAMDSV